ncbi:MAG: hypothetical protein ACYTBJ_02380 [Planctomycetota bacterium]|jgi:hypothetical protein
MALMTLDAWGVAKQTTTAGLTKSTTYGATFVTSSDGTKTTFVSSTLGGKTTTNAEIAGWYVQVLECQNGYSSENGLPLIRKVTAWNDSTDTGTIEALPFSTASGDKFALYVSPTGPFVETSGGSQTNIVDTKRTEANDYFVGSAEQGGQYVIAFAADNVALTANALVYDFDAATDTLSTASLGANTAVGDVYQPIVWPESPDGPLTLTNARLDRGTIIGQRGQIRGVAGLVEVSGQKTLMFHGPGASRAGSASEWDLFLGSVFTPTAVDNFTVSTGSTTANVVLSTGTPAANNLYVTDSGDVFMASAYTSPNVTASPALRTAPTATQTCYGMRKYVGADVANYALAHFQWHGKEVKDELFGTLPTITFEATRGDWFKMVMNFQGQHGYRVHRTDADADISRGFNPKVSTVTPQMLGCTRVNIDGTEFEARQANIDMGIELQLNTNLCAPNALDGPTIRDVKPTFTLDLFLDDDSENVYHKFVGGKPMTMLIQVNEAVGEPGVCALWAYEVELTAFEIGDDQGQKTANVQGRVTVDTTQSTLATWMLGIA